MLCAEVARALGGGGRNLTHVVELEVSLLAQSDDQHPLGRQSLRQRLGIGASTSGREVGWAGPWWIQDEHLVELALEVTHRDHLGDHPAQALVYGAGSAAGRGDALEQIDDNRIGRRLVNASGD